MYGSLYRSSQASNILRLINPPLTPKWTAALDWLDGELERRQVYPQYTDWGRSALQISNENSSNSTFLERSNSARTLLAKAREVFPSTPPADALAAKQAAAAGAKGSAAPARAGSLCLHGVEERAAGAAQRLSSSQTGRRRCQQCALWSVHISTAAPAIAHCGRGRAGRRGPAATGQSGEEGGDGETPAEYDAMDEDDPDDEGERGGASDDEDDVPETENYPSGRQLGGDHRSPPITAEHPASGSSGTRRAPPPYEDARERQRRDEATQHPVLAHGLQTPVNLGFGSATEQEQMPEVFIPSAAGEALPVTSNEPASRPPSPSSQPPAPGGRIESTNL